MEMDQEELLREYSEEVKRLRQQCRDAGLSDSDFRQLYLDSNKSLENENTELRVQQVRISYKYKLALLGFILLFGISYNFKAIYSNLQEYIYPGLKVLRRLSIPIISLFPSLTDLYSETCLIHNPFFTVVDMDCWPCSSVSNVREIYDPKTVDKQQSTPFTYETNQQLINLEHLKHLYKRNKETFDRESSKVLVNNKYHVTPSELFAKDLGEEKNFYIWRFNNMNMNRLLRQIIPRPKVVPKFGQSTERFIVIDTSQEYFRIPDTECSYSFLLSVSGSRTIDLIPADECKHQCKTLKVELKELYLIWYNWWYWRPVVQSSTGNSTFIAHVGSYC